MSFVLITLYLTTFGWLACVVQPSSAAHHQLRAVFSMGGIKGDVTFTQTQVDGTTSILVNLTGNDETLKWSIQQLPMIYDGNAAMSCSAGAVGETFDPKMAKKAPKYSQICGAFIKTRFEACAIGDLGRMLGDLTAANIAKEAYNNPRLAVPLQGPNSIMGRTLVFYKQDGVTPRACALITPVQPMRTAVAVFKAPVAGHVYLRQVDESSDTAVFVNLFHVDSSKYTSVFKWQIEQDVVYSFSDPVTHCRSSRGIFNPRNVEDKDCNKVNHENCSIGHLTSKHGDISVSMATPGQSKTKKAFTDANLPLFGANSVIGKSIVLFSASDPSKPVACAKIMEVQPRVLKASFQARVHDGVNGYFRFTQRSPFDPTTAEINLSGLQGRAQGYHVHSYPSPYRSPYAGSEACAGSFLGGHWNPFGVKIVTSPSPGNGTEDEYEVGDLSGKYGTFLNSNSYNKKHIDYNLPMFDKNSIQGRSIVIHKLKTDGNKRWVCTGVHPPVDEENTFVMMTTVTFKGPTLSGMILLAQYKSKDDKMIPEETSIYIDLIYAQNSTKKTMNHKWHVHVNPEGNDTEARIGERCKTMGGHFNPYGVEKAGSYKSSCGSGNMLRCEVGDLSGKHAPFNVGFGRQFYTDTDLPLFGHMSVVGRGIVVHAENTGSPRIACGTISPVTSLYVEKTLQFVEGAGFSKIKFAKVMSGLLNISEWRIFYIRTKDTHGGCLAVKFGILGNEKQASEPCKKFDLILHRYPEKFQEYSPSARCVTATKEPPVLYSGARGGHVNFIVIAIILLLTGHAL